MNDDRRALEWWRQCETADSYYKRGRLYQYQDGAFPQDLNEAERLFEKAVSMKHNKASEELRKVQNWKAERNRKVQTKPTNYTPRTTYSYSSSSSSSSGGDLCVITSATCTALNKPDDCEELNALRAYRDKMKHENPIIATLIEEYYRVAPLLVKKIDSETESEKIYYELWKNSIAETYRLIKAGQNMNATLIYIDMVQIEFDFNQKKTVIQGNLQDSFREIVYKFINKVFCHKNGAKVTKIYHHAKKQ